MTIKGLNSSFDATIDVNNGLSTQTFEQIGDAEYDVDVGANPSPSTIDIGIGEDEMPFEQQEIAAANINVRDNVIDVDMNGTVDIVADIEVDIEQNASGESNVIDLKVGGVTVDSTTTVGSGVTLSFSGTVNDSSASVGLYVDGWQVVPTWNTLSVDVRPEASPTVNSITQV